MKTTSKLALLAGAAIGYVLGARAGRERYEQIADGAAKIWDSKPVQQQVDKAQGLIDQYVPKIVEDGFSLAGKGAAGLMSMVTKPKKTRSGAAEAPTGTVDNPAH